MSTLRAGLLLCLAAALPPGFAFCQEAGEPPPAPPADPAPPPRQPEPAGGPGGLDLMGGRGGAPGYSATWYPSRRVAGQPADLGFVRQGLTAGAPLWRDGGDTLLLTASVRNTHFFADAVLPDTRRPFPANLWNVSLGLGYTHQFENGWSAGAMTSVGSPSDRPFHSIDEMNATLIAHLRVPAHEGRDAWLFSLMYSPAGNLNFPIPGLAYAWRPSESFQANIGLPFSLTWRPAEDLTLNMSYVPLTNVNARATYRLADGLHLYGGYEFLNESYFLADRANRTDRFMVFEQRLVGGVRWDVWRHAALDVNAGYSFGRELGEGRNQGSSLRDKVDVAPGAFVGASLRVRF